VAKSGSFSSCGVNDARTARSNQARHFVADDGTADFNFGRSGYSIQPREAQPLTCAEDTFIEFHGQNDPSATKRLAALRSELTGICPPMWEWTLVPVRKPMASRMQ